MKARADAAEKALTIDYPRLVASYESKAAELADIAESLKSIDDEAEAVNHITATRRRTDPSGSHPNIIRTSTERYRSEADDVVADRVETDQKWMVRNGEGRLDSVMVFGERDGALIPSVAGAELRTSTRIVPGRTRKGRSLAAPTVDLHIPAARLGGADFWPRGA